MGSDEICNLDDLYEQYSGPIFDYLMRFSGDYFLADELTGETFYPAILSLDSFRGEASVSTWLFRIARNLYFKKVKAKAANFTRCASGARYGLCYKRTRS